MEKSQPLFLAGQREEMITGIYRRHAPQIYAYLLAKLGNIQDAEDVTAQTFMAALDGLSKYRGEGEIAAWLLGIARNKAAMYWRKHKRQISLEAVADLPHTDPSPEETMTGQMRLEKILSAIQHLSPDRAEVLYLRLFAGLNNAEVSRVMKKSEPAVRMLLSRAVADLKKMMEE